MRTTISIDDDVAAAVDRLRREQGLGLSAAVNQLARAGMRATPRRRTFRQRTARLGLRIDVSNVAEVLDALGQPPSR